jgi:hypothetical protein
MIHVVLVVSEHKANQRARKYGMRYTKSSGALPSPVPATRRVACVRSRMLAGHD